MRKIGRGRKWKNGSGVLNLFNKREGGLYGALQKDTISSMAIMEMMDVEKIRQILR